MDSHWLEQCREGDTLAIERLVETHQQDVYRLALSILDEPDEAEEATQDVFLSALRGLDSFRQESSLKTWLFSITINRCRSRLGRRRRLGRLQQILQNLFSGDQPEPESEAMQHESDATLWRAVRTLNDRHRIPIILRYYHELPVADIAEILGVPVGTIHSRLNHAREKLGALLKKEER